MQPGRPGGRPWSPTRLVRVIKSFDTSMGTTLIETDQGEAFIKTLGNRQGPHALASEFVGSSLARLFGLAVPDFAIIPLPPDACFPLPHGARAEPGPAWLSRRVEGRTWGGSEAELKRLVNRDDITRLIVFDTWVRNCDRHPPDLSVRKPNYNNVFLADTDRPKRARLMAIDHTHCFDCGRDLTSHLSDIERIKDEGTYGMFPGFERLVDLSVLNWAAVTLRSITAEAVREIVAAIPPEWSVSPDAAEALTSQILGRAAFLADRIDSGWPTRKAAG